MTPKLPIRTLLELIKKKQFGVEYQPIISLHDESVMGYEALARFYDADGSPLSPQLVFDSLHANLLSLFQVEYEMKQLQLAHAPKENVRLFVNLDPDAFLVGNSDATNPFVSLLANSNHLNVVVEIIENSNISDAEISEAMVSGFSGSENIELALDDIGAPHTMLSLPIMLTVDFLKFDRSWLEHINNPVHNSALSHLVAFAHESGKKTILEGIEAPPHILFAKTIGFDYVQGFLYQHLFKHAN